MSLNENERPDVNKLSWLHCHQLISKGLKWAKNLFITYKTSMIQRLFKQVYGFHSLVKSFFLNRAKMVKEQS